MVQFPNSIRIQLDETFIALKEVEESLWINDDIKVTLEKNTNDLDILLNSPIHSVKRIEVTWKKEFHCNTLFLGDAWERAYGDLSWQYINSERVMPWYFLFNSDGITEGFGVKTGCNAFCSWQVEPDSITLWLDVRNGNSGVKLGNRKLDVATVVNIKSKEIDEFKVAQMFCSLMCDNPKIVEEPIYGGNDWYYAYGNNSYEKIIKHTDLIAELAEGLKNRPYMVIDDGWQICHNEYYNGGPWSYTNYKFPDMRKLVNEIKKKDVIPGIWFRPLLTTEEIRVGMELGIPKRDKILDPSNREVLEKVATDIKSIKEWGFKLIKHDFSTFDILGRWGFEMNLEITGGNWNFQDRTKTTAEIIKNFYHVIKEAAGDVKIIGCNTISHLAAGIFEIQRTGDDTSGLEWGRTRKYGVNTLAFRMPQHKRFYCVDADCVGVTKNIPWELNKQWLDLLANSGTPLFVSCDPEAITKEIKKDLKEAFKIASLNTKVAIPKDWKTNIYPKEWNINNGIVEYNWYEENRDLYFGK